ncbi:STRN4 protein, partial [Balaeniceps rex]|nr:STRN4 protein [Balaeniceps rex]
DPGVLSGVLEGHGDAVWGLAFNPAGDRLAFCSTDGTVRIWDPRHEDGACLSTYDAQSGERGRGVSPRHRGRPRHPPVTLPVPPLQNTVSPPLSPSRPPSPAMPWWLSGRAPRCSTTWMRLDPQVNQVVSHPSQPLTITASDDRGIRFLDNRTGTPGSPPSRTPGFPPLLAGHDCSLRLWHLAHKTCVQELTAHRKKHEEAVHAVAFHPSRALSASAGADALAKVFV